MMLTRNAILQNRYRIIDMIGQGGMGAVYQATDQRLKSTVALKQTFFNDEELGRAFEHEARLLASLCHPSLPRVSDYFAEGDGQFLVMEFIQGDDLAKLLKRKAGPFDCDQVLVWGYQLLDALEYLHSHRPPIVHRDIKPQNLKLTHRGQIILLDFGLAKGAPQLLEHGTASSLFGYTLNYAPLEQIQHTGTDPRSDLYSFGATLYHLMTARTPLGSLSRAVAVVSGEPDPLPLASEVNPQVPLEVAQVIGQAMALRPENRHTTATEMLKALREACPRPPADHRVFSMTSTTVAPPALNRRIDSPKKTSVLHPAEPVTRPIRRVKYAAPKPAPMIPVSAPEPERVISPLRPPWKMYVSVLAILICILLLTFDWSPKFTPKTPDRPVITPPSTMTPPSQPRPTPPPLGQVLSSSPLPAPPSWILPANGKLTTKNGYITLRWSPVPEAVAYKIVVAIKDLSHSWFVAQTTDTAYELYLDDKVAHILLVAIDAKGQESASKWWPIDHQ